MILIAAVCVAVALWTWPGAEWTLCRVVDRPPPNREARWLGKSRGGPDPFDVAAAYDVFAVCLRSGLPVSSAAEVAAEHAPAVVSDSLRRAAELLALGADADTAWTFEKSDAPSFADLASLARRASRAGAALADGVADLASDIRRVEADRALAAAEKAGVKVSGPLGLCFLPAFVCLGIVPVVVGLASGMLGSV